MKGYPPLTYTPWNFFAWFSTHKTTHERPHKTPRQAVKTKRDKAHKKMYVNPLRS